jgi:hypothetical protein
VLGRATWSMTLAILVAGCSNAVAPSTSSALHGTASPSAVLATGSSRVPTPSPVTSNDATATPTAGDAAVAGTAACEAILDDIPLVAVRSGKPMVAGAFEVTGVQLANYFRTVLNQTGSNGSVWWDQPTKWVDLCLFDGDFNMMAPGPSGHDTSAARVLVVISNGDAEFWAST